MQEEKKNKSDNVIHSFSNHAEPDDCIKFQSLSMLPLYSRVYCQRPDNNKTSMINVRAAPRASPCLSLPSPIPTLTLPTTPSVHTRKHHVQLSGMRRGSGRVSIPSRLLIGNQHVLRLEHMFLARALRVCVLVMMMEERAKSQGRFYRGMRERRSIYTFSPFLADTLLATSRGRREKTPRSSSITSKGRRLANLVLDASEVGRLSKRVVPHPVLYSSLPSTLVSSVKSV